MLQLQCCTFNQGEQLGNMETYIQTLPTALDTVG